MCLKEKEEGNVWQDDKIIPNLVFLSRCYNPNWWSVADTL